MAPLLISGAISLASKYLPKLIGSITGDEDKEDVASKVISVGSELLGHPIEKESDLNDLSGVLQTDPEAVIHFREHVMDKVESILSMELQDTQNARSAAVQDEKTGKLMVRMAWLVMITSYLAIGGLIAAGYFIMTNLESFTQSQSAALMTIIGAALSQMYTERNQIMGYIYGNKVANKVSDLMMSISGKGKDRK